MAKYTGGRDALGGRGRGLGEEKKPRAAKVGTRGRRRLAGLGMESRARSGVRHASQSKRAEGRSAVSVRLDWNSWEVNEKQERTGSSQLRTVAAASTKRPTELAL
eukprot:236084-Pleurochrysis_carterae.AAC.1